MSQYARIRKREKLLERFWDYRDVRSEENWRWARYLLFVAEEVDQEVQEAKLIEAEKVLTPTMPTERNSRRPNFGVSVQDRCWYALYSAGHTWFFKMKILMNEFILRKKNNPNRINKKEEERIDRTKQNPTILTVPTIKRVTFWSTCC